MKERKDLKRMSAAMMKVKSPLKNGDEGGELKKVPTLGAQKIRTEIPGTFHDPVVGTRKELMIHNFAKNTDRQNAIEFQGGIFGDNNELAGYLEEISKSNEPMLRNPGDRAIRNKKLGKKFDRGL